jgi:CRISPR/Cas system CSM-associated protein Csm2 small subunit
MAVHVTLSTGKNTDIILRPNDKGMKWATCIPTTTTTNNQIRQRYHDVSDGTNNKQHYQQQ